MKSPRVAVLGALALLAPWGAAALPASVRPPDTTPVVRLAALSFAVAEPVPPYAILEFELPSPARAARVWIPGVPGETRIEARRVRFLPDQALVPGAVHPVLLEAELADGPRVARALVPVLALEGAIWVDVDLSIPQRVRVYRGRQLLRAMAASAGREGDETPLGLYRVQDRGEHFFSRRYGQGAYCWVRFHGNYLFHSLPVDEQGRVIEEERARLGLPASHGCIRLSFEDARWFYEHVPGGALVLIHR